MEHEDRFVAFYPTFVDIRIIRCNKKGLKTSKKQKMKYFKQFPLELIFWITALVLLRVGNSTAHHFSFCLLSNLGFETWCPGCGIGRSISCILNGEFEASFKQHWFGFPALLILLHRIYTLLQKIEFKKILNT